MANETDFPPVEYLQRRIVYYKKKCGTIRNWHRDKTLTDRYGKRQIKKFQKSAIARIEGRISEYENAIKTLTS